METLTVDPGLPSRPREVLPGLFPEILSTDYLRVMRTWRTRLGHWVGERVPLGHLFLKKKETVLSREKLTQRVPETGGVA